MNVDVRPFLPGDADAWDRLVRSSVNGTFLHSRRFLAYHRDRFTDQSVCIYDGDHLVGVFPAALDPGDGTTVVSHPGATYGGLVHDGHLCGGRSIAALEALREYYSSQGLRKLRYKAIPRIYHRLPSDDDLYALFRCDALRQRCDLCAAIDLARRGPVSSRRKRSLKVAKAAEVEVIVDESLLPGLWNVLEENLARKHDARPVHTREEMALLHDLFPKEICFVCGLVDHELIAGVVLFLMPTVVHAQYICSSELGYKVNALDAVFDRCISLATERGADWFSFGICNEDNGKVLNEGLYQFKTEFGAGGVCHEFYEVMLT